MDDNNAPDVNDLIKALTAKSPSTAEEIEQLLSMINGEHGEHLKAAMKKYIDAPRKFTGNPLDDVYNLVSVNTVKDSDSGEVSLDNIEYNRIIEEFKLLNPTLTADQIQKDPEFKKYLYCRYLEKVWEKVNKDRSK